MAGHSVPITQCINHIAPILTPAATEVFGNIDESERCDYNTVKTILFKHYPVTQESYRSSMDSFKRKSEESWSTCGMRFYHLTKKWAKDCTTVESLLALVTWDSLYKLMPRQMANIVKDKKPHTFEEALEMVDDFATTRGWSYKLLEDAE